MTLVLHLVFVHFFQLMDYNIHYDPQTIVEAEHDIVNELLKTSGLNAVQKKTVR